MKLSRYPSFKLDQDHPKPSQHFILSSLIQYLVRRNEYLDTKDSRSTSVSLLMIYAPM